MFLKTYIHPVWYALSDYIAALLTWVLFYKVRESLLPDEIFTANFSSDNYLLWASVFFIPLGWLAFYLLIGSYQSLYKKIKIHRIYQYFSRDDDWLHRAFLFDCSG